MARCSAPDWSSGFRIRRRVCSFRSELRAIPPGHWTRKEMMQTFVPYDDYVEIGKCLDTRRLGKQILEARQIINAMENGGGWANHPATKMWRNYKQELAVYGLTMYEEWIWRGYDSHHGSAEFFEDVIERRSCDRGRPMWWGREDVMLSHQSNLVKKDPDHYRKFFPDVPDDLPYVWPGGEDS